jgi:hypothetical protein
MKRVLAGLVAVMLSLGCLQPVIGPGLEWDQAETTSPAAAAPLATSRVPAALAEVQAEVQGTTEQTTSRAAEGATDTPSRIATGADTGRPAERLPSGPARVLHQCACTHAVAARAAPTGDVPVMETTRVGLHGRAERMPASPPPARHFRPPVLPPA